MSFSKTIKPTSFFKTKYIPGGEDHERIALTDDLSCLATITEASPG